MWGRGASTFRTQEVSLPVRLPKELAAGRRERARTIVACPITFRVRLAAGVDRVEFHTEVDNRARDHRLRVLFASPDSPQKVRAEGHFALLRRPAQPVWNGRWREPPARTHHTLGLVAAGDLAVVSRGLPEYEAVPKVGGGVDVALTLLRCVGWLSWPDLSTRPGAEEPHVPTPDAQCLGTHSFQYALTLRGDDDAATLLRASQDYRVELVRGPEGIDLERTLAVEGSSFAFSALKGAEDGDGVVVRLFNPGDGPAIAQVTGAEVAVHRCRLDEEETQTQQVRAIAMKAGEIATARIIPGGD
ncbi:MAG TPA: glycosyl hydrolase-related protein [Chloroflexota bacterium]|nr:glycosyl hydrolase-related protein [Chloroflexota bacterium]